MKNLRTKSEITAANLKSEDCNYRGHRIGFDQAESLYLIGSWNNNGVNYYQSVKELKMCF